MKRRSFIKNISLAGIGLSGLNTITGDNKREVVSFGTEAGLFQEIGISTVVCGPGSIEQAHTIDEFIELNEIKKCLSFLEGVKERSVIN